MWVGIRAVVAMVLAALALDARAAFVQLEFDSLPSAQGWVFVPYGSDAGTTETEVFSVTGGVLVQNSIGQSLGGPGATTYSRAVPLAPGAPYAVTWRSRVLVSEGDPSSSLYGYGFQVVVRNGSASVMIAMTTDRVRDHLLQTVFRSNTGFHDFRLEVDPPTGYQLWVDGVPTLSGALGSLGSNTLEVGDGSGITNALAELSAFTFYQPGVPPGVPETMTVEKLSADASTLSLSWDVLTCSGAADHHIVFGTGSQLPGTPGGTYGLSGSNCGIGTVSPFIWEDMPDPSPDPTGLLWWLVVASDAAEVEGSWGTNGLGEERSGPSAGGASGECGIALKDLTNTCGR